MTSYPQDVSLGPQSHKAIDHSNSVITETKIKTLGTSRDEVQSFVIVNDIDVEEELHKAHREDNRNFFKMLSMSFYGRVKSHSLDTQETRDANKLSSTPQSGIKSAFPRKPNAHTPPESKRDIMKGVKQKSNGAPKKSSPLIKDLPLTPEQFRRHLLTPKDMSVKMFSPVIINTNFSGALSSKDGAKKDSPFFAEAQLRAQTCSKSGGNRRTKSGKKSGSSEGKTPIGKDDSPIKTNVFKLSRYPLKMAEQTEEKVQMTNMEPSNFDMRLEEAWETEKEKDRDASADNILKDINLMRKQNSKRETSKPGQDKSANNSGRSLHSANSVKKNGTKDTLEVKRIVLDPDFRPSTAIAFSKSSKKEDGKVRKNAKQKASSQRSKNSSEDKLHNRDIIDLQDSDTEERYIREGQVRKNEGKNRQKSLRVERQRSPIATKIQERVPIAMNGGIGSWGKALMFPSNELTPKGSQKEKRKESGSLEGKEKKSEQSQSQTKKSVKSKTNSTEKLGKMDLLTHLQMKKGDWFEQERNAYTPKFDVLRQKGGEKTWKLFELYGKLRETKERGRPNSPSIEDSQRPFDLLNHILTAKKHEKI